MAAFKPLAIYLIFYYYLTPSQDHKVHIPERGESLQTMKNGNVPKGKRSNIDSLYCNITNQPPPET
jgi:hypothetical protein